MKKNIIVLTALAFAALSCAKSPDNIAETPVPENIPTASVTFSVTAGELTKASGITDDEKGTAKVSSLQVIVFDKNGKTVASANAASDTTISLRLPVTTAGIEYDIYGIANGNRYGKWLVDLSEIKLKSEFNNIVTSLSDNTPDNLLMAGNLKMTLNTSTESVVIPVKRLVAKIAVSKIVYSGTDNVDVTIKGIYIINAASKESLLGEQKTGYVNMCKDGQITFDGPEYLKDDVTFDLCRHSEKKDYTTAHQYFVYANDTTLTDTRLVVEALWDNLETCYYSVNLNKLNGSTKNIISPNNIYAIKTLTLKGRGADAPDEDISRVQLSVDINVVDWSIGFDEDVQI